MEINENDILAKNYSIEVGKAFEAGSEIIKKNIGGFIGFFILQMVIGLAIGEIFGGGIGDALKGIPKETTPLSVLGSVISNLISCLMYPGFFYVAHKISNREETSFGDFFYGFTHQTGQFLLLQIVSGILIVVGIVLLVIPGIYLAVAYSFAMCIMITYQQGFWESMEISRKVITKVWGQMFLLLLAILGINLLGGLLCGLGLIYTFPYSMCILYAAFRDVFKPGNEVMDDKISNFGQGQKDINTERDEDKV
jgi:hypothetical protein